MEIGENDDHSQNNEKHNDEENRCRIRFRYVLLATVAVLLTVSCPGSTRLWNKDHVPHSQSDAATNGTMPNNSDNNAFVRTLEPVHTAQTTPLLYYSIDFRNTSPVEAGPGAYRLYVGHGPGASAAIEIGINGSTLMAKNGARYDVIRELMTSS